MPRLDLVDGGVDRVDVERGLLVRALRAVLDHRRAAVVRDQVGVTGLEGRVELRDLREPVERLGDVLDRCLEGRILRRQRLGLDQDDLALLVGIVDEPGVDDLVGLAGFADVGLVVLEVLGSDRVADCERGDDEGEPAEDRGLPVARTPAAHAGCEIARVLQR
jgi:hypothetical protein